MWSAQNTAFDHIFDHLQTRTTWKQCSQEHTKAPFLDTKAPKITRNYTKNLCRTLRDAKVVGSIPVASTKTAVSPLVVRLFSILRLATGSEGGSRFAGAKRFALRSLDYEKLDGKGRR